MRTQQLEVDTFTGSDDGDGAGGVRGGVMLLHRMRRELNIEKHGADSPHTQTHTSSAFLPAELFSASPG